MTYLASEDNNVVDVSRSLVRYELADDETADLSSADYSKVLVLRHIDS